MIFKCELWGAGADGNDTVSDAGLPEAGNDPAMNGLRLSWNVPFDELLTLGKNRTKRASALRGSGFFERSPLHR